jgi:hypothetical protein
VNDLRINRNRQESLADLINRLPSSPPGGARSLLVQTTTQTTYPTSAGVFYAVVAVDVTGDETEGATPTFSAQSQIFYALNLGTAVPPSGTNILADFIGGIALFRWDN